MSQVWCSSWLPAPLVAGAVAVTVVGMVTFLSTLVTLIVGVKRSSGRRLVEPRTPRTPGGKFDPHTTPTDQSAIIKIIFTFLKCKFDILASVLKLTCRQTFRTTSTLSRKLKADPRLLYDGKATLKFSRFSRKPGNLEYEDVVWCGW